MKLLKLVLFSIFSFSVQASDKCIDVSSYVGKYARSADSKKVEAEFTLKECKLFLKKPTKDFPLEFFLNGEKHHIERNLYTKAYLKEDGSLVLDLVLEVDGKDVDFVSTTYTKAGENTKTSTTAYFPGRSPMKEDGVLYKIK